MDITNFMSWFVSQVVNIFTQAFNILDSITFSGTSVLKVLVTIIILSTLLGVILTISSPGLSFRGNKSDKVKERNKNNEKES